ncbi:MAG: sulfatase-like hydrolase/transferase [Bacteroidetes bacterium]|nr:sulfatase-like hydrolase/transferase [Bacteroidota bacterium]
MEIIKQLFKHYLYLIAIFFIGRLLLFIWQFDRFFEVNESYWLSFIYGLKMDTILALALLFPMLFLLTLSPKFLSKLVDKLIAYYYLTVLMLVVYVESATFPFFAQYDVRPNYLFVEYLEYIEEVSAMLIADYKLALLLTFAAMFVVAKCYSKNIKDRFLPSFELAHMKRMVLLLPLLLIFVIGIRSSFGHRPANISDALYSSNRVLNEITKNSLYSVLYAIYANKYESNVKEYGSMPIDDAIDRVKRKLNIQGDHSDYIFNRAVATNFVQQKPKNLVIFIQESIGTQFVESIGGEAGITPNFNRLSNEGLLFTDTYSNGTRSIRGLAGLVAGNFSVPGKGVLKRNKSQQDFFTVASLLKSKDYETVFLYGGESRFDNMKSWFSGNGFDRIIEQTDFIDPKFVGSWGVSDEDLVIRSNQEFRQYHKNNQKFAAVMFSTSNHAPFDFPEEKIELIDGIEVKSVKNAIKYADHAIGEFIKLARQEDYYKDTIFVIVADHDVRVYGDDLVPVNRFHIPALILGESISPGKYEKIATQPDILATSLDLIGIDELNYPIQGHSIFSDKKQNIALMQFNDYYALRENNKVSVIRPGKEALTFVYRDEKLHPVEHDINLEKDVLAFVLTLDHLYNNNLHR